MAAVIEPPKRHRGRPKGHKLSEETKKKIAEARTGKKQLKETKKKIAKSLKQYFIENPPEGLPQGTTFTLSTGYVLIKVDNNWVVEHRYNMECYLGRKLLPEEIVHHKDFTKDNNEVSNLQIMTQSEHMKLHAFFKNRNSKNWVVITPDNERIKVYNLAKYCEDNNLSVHCMRAVAHGKTVKGVHKGYRCELIDKE